MPPLKVDAPASANYVVRQKIARAKALRGKTGRTPAETQELVDTLLALVPDDVRAALGS